MKKFKKLCKSYKKKLEKVNKDLVNGMTTPLDCFVTSLEFQRDILFLEAEQKNELNDDNMVLATIITAIEEYNKFCSCITTYYDITPNSIKHKETYTEELAVEAYKKERQLHWQNFWSIVATYSEVWSAC